MKKPFRKQYIIISMVVFALIFGASIASAQNGNRNNSPPEKEQKNTQTQNQNQPSGCVSDCDKVQAQDQNQVSGEADTQVQNQTQNQTQVQVNEGSGTQHQHQNQHQNQVNDCADCPMANIILPEDVIAAIELGLSDEYLAYAVYSAIIEQFGEIIPFSNIQQAESTHIWVWEKLFDKYGLTLPDSPTVDVPTFDTVADACAYALEVELENIGLYEDILAIVADYQNLTQLVTALQSASFNHHIPALEACAAQ